MRLSHFCEYMLQLREGINKNLKAAASRQLMKKQLKSRILMKVHTNMDLCF